PDMHRPEGLTFGPDGKLYVTGYRADASDTDKILALDPTSGAEVNSIVLDAVGQPRAYGQGILFGPGGRLFVPISTLDSPFTGAIRSYDVGDGSFVNFAPPGTLGSGWYLTFGRTDPATLAYQEVAGAAAAGTPGPPPEPSPGRAAGAGAPQPGTAGLSGRAGLSASPPGGVAFGDGTGGAGGQGAASRPSAVPDPSVALVAVGDTARAASASGHAAA